MQDLNLSDTLRYLCIGYILFGFLFIYDEKMAINLLNDFGVIIISVFAFLAGCITYLIYKPIIYIGIITFLLDSSRNEKKKNYNCRTYLRGKYGINRIQAENFWFLLYNEYDGDKKFLEKESSGIHFMYMLGSISLLFSITELFKPDNYVGKIILFLAIIIMLSAFIHERYIEDYEFILMCSIGEDKRNKLAVKLKYINEITELFNKNLKINLY